MAQLDPSSGFRNKRRRHLCTCLALQTEATDCLDEVSHGKWENDTCTNKKPFLVYLLFISALDQIVSSLPLFGGCSLLDAPKSLLQCRLAVWLLFFNVGAYTAGHKQ